MGPEAGAAPDHVVVAHDEQTVVHVLGVVVAAEAEAVPRVEPVQAGVEAVGAATDVDGRIDGGRGHGIRSHARTIVAKTIIVKETTAGTMASCPRRLPRPPRPCGSRPSASTPGAPSCAL